MNNKAEFFSRALTNKLKGKTIDFVVESEVESQYGNNPVITLHFTDNTTHSFVLPE